MSTDLLTAPSGGRLDRYRIAGGSAAVPDGTACRAVDVGSGTPVILKRVPRAAVAPALVEEARRLPRIFLPGIPSVYEVWEEEGDLWLAFEAPAGRPLSELLAAGEGIDRETLVTWGSQLLVLLAEAHAQGVLHRHLGDRAVALRADGRLTLRGFGLTRLEDDPSVPAAPETEAGEPATVATDLYALGLLLARLAAAGPAGRLGRPEDDPLAAVIARATAADPARRWPDAAEMERALRQAAEAPCPRSPAAPVPRVEVPRAPEVPGAEVPGAETTRPTRAARAKRRRGPAIAAAVLLAAAAGGGLLLWRSGLGPGAEPSPPSSAPTGASSPASSAAPSAGGETADPARLLEQARRLLENGEAAAADALLQRLLDEALLPNPVPALDTLGTLRLQAGRTAEAAELLERAAALQPSAGLHYKLGLALAAEGRRQEALDSLRAARDLDPESEEIRQALDHLRGAP
jgi:serine/threonine-protein kinase